MPAVLAASLLAVPPASAAPVRPEPLKGQAEKLDKHGGEIRGVNPKLPAMAAARLPEPVWPVAGRAQVTLTDNGKPKRAGALAVSVAQGSGAAGDRLSEVSVEVLDRAGLPRQWRDGVVARVAAPDDAQTGGKAAVTIDYSGFRHAYGAGWSSRLRMWSLPECALTTPQKAACAATELPARNNPATGAMTAETTVPVAPAATKSTLQRSASTSPAAAARFVALAAAPSGASGDFTATSLAASSTWSTGGSAGSFNWNYPMRAPVAIAGPKPTVELSYSSASVDGRSSATNNQPSWIGEGFEFEPGFIERRYVGCSDDKADDPNNPERTGDMCWRSDNATMSLNGSGGELVYEKGKGWHSRTEDGSKIEKLTGGSNGDDNGEYWKATTKDGTQYFFGLNSLPGQAKNTESAWTAPVYGNHSGEPCHGTKFADSDCAQAWRWNLDYVVDVHGNTLSFWYEKEANNYAAEGTTTKKTPYTRGGHLVRTDYGTWDRGSTDRSVKPLAQVEFTPADRCLSDCGTHDAKHWPDTPWDQECKSDAANCGSNYSPTFWTTKRLSKVTTRVWDTTKITAGWQNVDSWTLGHSFPSPGDGQPGGLWLSSIEHTGHVGGTAKTPMVTLDPVAMPNRVLTQSNTTNNWQRLAAVRAETGAITQVTYSLPECTSSNLPSSAHDNTKLCYPVIGPDPHSTSNGDITEWWHKYVVRQITETDVQLADGHQAPTKNTYYAYEGEPAWHYADDDGLTKAKYKTWNQFRGFAAVTTQVGDNAKTLMRTTYLRGMHGDRATKSGGTRTVTVPASIGSETVYDEDQFAGMAREQIVYDGVTSRPVSKTVNVPWRSPATASRTINGDVVQARYVNTRTTYTATALGVDGSRGWRTTSATTEFDDTYGTPVWTQEDGDTGKTGDEKCTTYTYHRNTAKNLITLPSRSTVTALRCGVAPSSAAHVVSDVRTFYDGATDPATPPQRGLTTRVDGMKDWSASGGTTWLTTGSGTFDAFGRQLTSTDVRKNTTTTAYTPAAGIVTQEVATNQLGWATTTEKNPYWGLVTKTTDPNGRVNEVAYDALGRLVEAWNIGWSRSANPAKPSVRYSYVYSANRSAYPYVKSEKLNTVGGYDVSYDIFDGLLRPRQTQTQVKSGERVVVDTLYDAHGRVELTYGAHAEPGSPSGTLWWEPEWSVPSQTRTLFDRANRITDTVFLSGDGVTNIVERWRTSMIHEGDRTTLIPPAGGTASTTIVDTQGRNVEIREYTTDAGRSGAYHSTKYAYDSKDKLTLVTDTAGNEWKYQYDIRGRRTEEIDPDRGRTAMAYNDLGDKISSTDQLGKTVQFTYDSMGRRTAMLDAPVAPSTTATKRAEWIYDRLYTGVTLRGQLTQSIRHDAAGNQYKWQARGFTTRYQPTGVNYVIPANETGLAGTYVYGYGYSPFNGTPTSLSYPAGGNLADEQVTTVYDGDNGRPAKLTTAWSGVDTYVAGQEYSSYGEPTVTTMKITGGTYAQQAYSYDTYTRRLDTVKVKPETATGTVSQVKYTYDNAGNILGVANTPEAGETDRQCFEYDALRRLTTGWTPSTAVDCATAKPTVDDLGGPAAYWTDWTLDALGNRTSEVSHAAAGDTVRRYTVPKSGAGAIRPHAVTAMTTTRPGETSGTTDTYGYDDTGNMINRSAAGQSLAWDVEGRVTQVTKNGAMVEENVYDVDGNRLIRRDAAGQTLFLPGMEIRRTVSAGATTFTGTRYYNFNGKTVASRTAGTQTLSWLFADHQGTQQIAVNASTQKVSVRRQSPYGAPRGSQPAWPNGKGFVGGDNDPTGLVNVGARKYDPLLGRFLSVDPMQDLSDPQQWNGYAYAGNNPITYADPTGLMVPPDQRSSDRQANGAKKTQYASTPTSTSTSSSPNPAKYSSDDEERRSTGNAEQAKEIRKKRLAQIKAGKFDFGHLFDQVDIDTQCRTGLGKLGCALVEDSLENTLVEDRILETLDRIDESRRMYKKEFGFNDDEFVIAFELAWGVDGFDGGKHVESRGDGVTRGVEDLPAVGANDVNGFDAYVDGVRSEFKYSRTNTRRSVSGLAEKADRQHVYNLYLRVEGVDPGTVKGGLERYRDFRLADSTTQNVAVWGTDSDGDRWHANLQPITSDFNCPGIDFFSC